MFPSNRKKVAKGKQFKYAKEEQTDTKIKSSVWNSSLLSNVYSFLFHELRGSTESHSLRVSVFQSFFTVLFPQKFHWLFSTIQQKIASIHENHYRVSKGLIKSLMLTECLPVLYIPLLCVLGVKCFPTTTLVRPAYWGVESVFCALWYLYFLQLWQTRGAEIAICASWQQLLTVVNSP